MIKDAPNINEFIFLLRIHGMYHQVCVTHRTDGSLIDASHGSETSCGLPLSESDINNAELVFFDIIEDPDFCQQCYDIVALKKLANV